MYSKLNNVSTPEVSDTTGVDHGTNAGNKKAIFFCTLLKLITCLKPV